MPHEGSPLLPVGGGGGVDIHGHPLSSARKTLGNVIISIVGAGVLGLPFTFKRSGWVVGVSCIILSAIISYYCMLLLVKCRERLDREGGHGSINTYSDLAMHVYGQWGFAAVDAIVLISQGGCCVAYLIFISENLASLLPLSVRFFFGDRVKLALILTLAFFQVLLSWVRSLTGLAPFSIFADVANLVAMALIIGDDIGTFDDFSSLDAFNGLANIPFAFGVACYCYEGFSMTLPLEASMKDRSKFPGVLAIGLTLITVLYVLFGSIGYFAFKDATKEIITLNLPANWSTFAVKLGLCVGLFFTFPVMMHPVHEIFERRLTSAPWVERTLNSLHPSPEFKAAVLKLVRALVVLLAAYVAIRVPGFAMFISIVGSTVCAMLAFVLPGVFHMHVHWPDIKWHTLTIDVVLLTLGFAFSCYGTYMSVNGGE